MNRRLFSALLIVVMLLSACGTDPDVKAVRELARRVMPEYASRIEFEKMDAPADCFVLRNLPDGSLLVQGRNAVSMAAGLGHYLRYVCKTDYSWLEDQPMSLPEVMPAVKEPIRLDCKVPIRFMLNYCTYGFTTTWWTWKEWSHFIDWMALNGVNLALAPMGQESIWLEVYRELGMNEEQILNFFCSPASLPWQWMNNNAYDGGPLPKEWIERSEKMQKKILRRLRCLGITPVLPAYNGHFPEELQTLYPDADYSRKYMSDWGDEACRNRSWFLDPSDSLFSHIQASFMRKQEKLYGSDHYYCVDLFNEMWAPSFEPDYLGRVASEVYESMKAVDPESIWVQMGWMMYFISNWTQEGIRSFVNGAPQGKMLIEDYYAENVEIYRDTEDFYGQDFIWCYLGNFGGNCDINASFDVVSKRLDTLFDRHPANFKGVGLSLEGFDCSPFMDEYVLERAWRDIDADEYWTELADRTLGREDALWRAAWTELRKVYDGASAQAHSGNALEHIPLARNGQWEGNRDAYIRDKGWWNNTYDTLALSRAWTLMNEVSPSERDSYRFWKVNVGRQLLEDRSNAQWDRLIDALNAKDVETVKSVGEEMSHIAAQMDSLLAGHQFFSLDKYLRAARACAGGDSRLADYYELSARKLITYYSDFSKDYSNDYQGRSWNGLVRDYYLPRWELCLSLLIDNFEKYGDWRLNDVYDEVSSFQDDFVHTTS